MLRALLSDSLSDIGVASNDLGIADQSYTRLRRARDRLTVVRSLLVGQQVAASCPEIGELMYESVELLARKWPREYPAGGLEWMLVEGCMAPSPAPSASKGQTKDSI
ncbi:hypothetical protein DLM46_17005 [Paraburkholderia lacunae]|uniref:Uncharacterized protein n=1 Tax=Paraburkholderia lacunae TaxID=2211104 RepID=A0A370N7D7_9BURK|nr:hypothetical protein DLM46_17005 [Paraburkholderia lacunae]